MKGFPRDYVLLSRVTFKDVFKVNFKDVFKVNPCTERVRDDLLIALVKRARHSAERHGAIQSLMKV